MAGEHHNSSEFPREITFKAVFHSSPFARAQILNACTEQEIIAEIMERDSRKGKFTSYTVTAVFADENTLNDVCGRITQIEGFITMF